MFLPPKVPLNMFSRISVPTYPARAAICRSMLNTNPSKPPIAAATKRVIKKYPLLIGSPAVRAFRSP